VTAHSLLTPWPGIGEGMGWAGGCVAGGRMWGWQGGSSGWGVGCAVGMLVGGGAEGLQKNYNILHHMATSY
jgi:hypothetical protein